MVNSCQKRSHMLGWSGEIVALSWMQRASWEALALAIE